MSRVLAAMGILGLAALWVPGCKSNQPSSPGQAPIQRGAAPEYATVAAAYNARVEPLNRLTAFVVLRLKYRDQDGKDQEEQVEARCGFVRPRNVLLTLTKAGQTVAMLGSNDTKYWWIELSEHKRAMVGQHDKADPERLAAAGIPVHPLDLIELQGTTPLPGATEPGTHSVAWSEDGKSLIVNVPGRFGSRRLTLNPDDYRPSRIELLDVQGRSVASSDLNKYESVAIRGAGPGVVHPWIATDLKIVADSGLTQGHLEISTPEINPSMPSATAFDLPRLLAAYDVQEIRSLDSPSK